MPAVCLEGPPTAPAAAASVSCPCFCHTASGQAPGSGCDLLSQCSQRTFPHANLIAWLHHLKLFPSSAESQTVSPAGKAFCRRLSLPPATTTPKVMPLAKGSHIFQGPGWFLHPPTPWGARECTRLRCWRCKRPAPGVSARAPSSPCSLPLSCSPHRFS